ncbi:transglutaminaseTgpA domain-containing protein [Chiayiivirga flava]|uniref:Transglutaminase-like putative cysteine protease n=1 Tax=Chiayiivirga flava TaxID=659595 RepID=A0A7W8D5V1_9GAMM|nr:transglutaminase-like putative cysteine protease [Chiayiivirga flava]
MKNAVTRNELDRTSFLWCAAAVVAALLPVLPALPAWLTGALLAVAGLGIGYGWLQRRLNAWVRLPLTLGLAALTLFAYNFRFGRDTGAALLATMLALKLLETRSVRDARSVLSFALFAIMAGFLHDQGPQTLLLALVATVLVLSALARIADVDLPGGPRNASVALRPRLIATATLLALSLPLAAVAFFLFPRLGSPMWGVPENVAEARTGLSNEMAPGDIANLFIDDSPVLRVAFDGPMPTPNALYWRGPVLGRFDGRTWRRWDGESYLDPVVVETTEDLLAYEVTQEPTDRRYMIGLDLPLVVPDGARVGPDRSVLSQRRLTDVTRFRMQSALRYRFEPDLRRIYRDQALELPANFNPRTRALIDEWRATDPAPEALIERSLQWFNREFTYNLISPLLGRHSVDEFLFDTKTGYCEHFASSFAVMMRMAGVPARVVTGYQGGYANDFGDYIVVRQSDAHAWTEVWLEGRGWVRIDPTSAVAPERIERGDSGYDQPDSLLGRLGKPLFDAYDFVRRGWNDLVLGFNAARQRSLLQPFGLDAADWPQLGAVLGVAVAAIMALTFVLLLRTPRGPRDPLRDAHARFVARLGRAGVPKLAHEPAQTHAERAAMALPHSADTIRSLSRRYVRRRYARVPEDAAADRALCDDLRRFRVRPSG